MLSCPPYSRPTLRRKQARVCKRGGNGAPSSSVVPHPGSSHTSRSSKFDPTKVKVTYLRCTGGDDVSAHIHLELPNHLLGLSPKEVGDDTAKATGDWKGLRVTVTLTIQEDRPRLRWYSLPLAWSSKPSRSHHKTETSGRTVNTVECHF